MLRFLGIYPIAILVAISVAAYFSKYRPMAAPAGFSRPIVQSPAPTRTAMAFAPPIQAVESDRTGNYIASVQLEGRELHMLIDTGASFLSLTHEDADQLGIRPSPADFTLRMQTANGISTAARTWLPRVRVGSVEVHDVEAIVMAKGASATSLLGMSFLGRLSRFGVSGGRMLLEQ